MLVKGATGNKPLAETMLTQIYVAMASIDLEELTATDMFFLSNEILKHFTKYPI